MPPDSRLYFLFRKFRALDCRLITHHHRRGRGQSGGPILLGLVFVSGLRDDLHVKVIFLTQPGHDLMKTVSGHAAGIVHKQSHFEHHHAP